MDAPNLTVERVEELREWLENVYDDFTYDDNCFLSPKGEQAQADLLALLDKEAASLAGQPAAPCGEDEATWGDIETFLRKVLFAFFNRDRFDQHDGKSIAAIAKHLATPAQPKPRVSRTLWVKDERGGAILDPESTITFGPVTLFWDGEGLCAIKVSDV